MRQSNGVLLSVERVQTGCTRLAMPAERPNPLDDFAGPPLLERRDIRTGHRRITVDRAGLKLLTWCEPPNGTDVTAITLERRSSTPYL